MFRLANSQVDSAKGKILVCFAVPEECKFFQQTSGVDILVTGMGRKNSLESLRKYPGNPRLVISAGFAGGLNPFLAAESVVFSSRDSSLLEAASSFHIGEVITVDRVCAASAEKNSLYAASRADAVDMESEALGEECARRGIPFCVIKVISDSASEDMPLDFNLFITPDFKMNLPKLIGHVILHPGKIPGLLRFQKRVQRSSRVLAQALNRFIEALQDQSAA